MARMLPIVILLFVFSLVSSGPAYRRRRRQVELEEEVATFSIKQKDEAREEKNFAQGVVSAAEEEVKAAQEEASAAQKEVSAAKEEVSAAKEQVSAAQQEAEAVESALSAEETEDSNSEAAEAIVAPAKAPNSVAQPSASDTSKAVAVSEKSNLDFPKTVSKVELNADVSKSPISKSSESGASKVSNAKPAEADTSKPSAAVNTKPSGSNTSEKKPSAADNTKFTPAKNPIFKPKPPKPIINFELEDPFALGAHFPQWSLKNMFKNIEKVLHQVNELQSQDVFPDNFNETKVETVDVEGQKFKVKTNVVKQGGLNNRVFMKVVSMTPTLGETADSKEKQRAAIREQQARYALLERKRTSPYHHHQHNKLKEQKRSEDEDEEEESRKSDESDSDSD